MLQERMKSAKSDSGRVLVSKIHDSASSSRLGFWVDGSSTHTDENYNFTSLKGLELEVRPKFSNEKVPLTHVKTPLSERINN